jgi:hypothetical protein
VNPDWRTAPFPGGTGPSHARPNSEGWVVTGGNGARQAQIFRDGGGLEARIDLSEFATSLNSRNGQNVDGCVLEFEIARWIKRAAVWFGAAQIEPPFAVYVSLLQVFNMTFSNINPETQSLAGDYWIDVYDVLLPEQFLDTIPEDIPKVLAPTFDALWQAASWPRSAARSDRGSVFYANSLERAFANSKWG